MMLDTTNATVVDEEGVFRWHSGTHCIFRVHMGPPFANGHGGGSHMPERDISPWVKQVRVPYVNGTGFRLQTGGVANGG